MKIHTSSACIFHDKAGCTAWAVQHESSGERLAATVTHLIFFIVVMAAWTAPAFAFQEHGPPEGLYVHQLAHIFFALSMTGLWYGIKGSSRFRDNPGWQLIATGAALLTMWNVVTFAGHILSIFTMTDFAHEGGAVSAWIEWTWHILKLDNIVCVAAMLYFYAGLRKLLHGASASGHETSQVNT